MKQLVLLFTALVLGTTGTQAVSTENSTAISSAYRFNNSFIFVEDGITFSVYPDGEFDFYIDNRANFGANVNIGRTNFTFNSGFDYNPFVQYDDYGAVIQVENVPVFYDHFGRVAQIGGIFINYRNGFVSRLGGMNVFYNNGVYAYHTGFINVFNRRYIFRPFHRFFVRPALGFCLVYNRPYRRFYNPIRYTWYRPYRYNTRRAFARIGREHRFNRVRRERARIYRNDRRVAVRQNTRRAEAIRTDRGVARRNNNVARTNRTVTQRGNVSRSNARRTEAVRTERNVTRRNNTLARTNQRGNITRNDSRTVRRDAAIRSNNTRGTAVDRSRKIENLNIRKADARPERQKTVTQRSTTVRNPKRSAVTKRTVTRSTKTYKSPQRATTNRSVRKAAPTRNRSNNVASGGNSRKTVSKATSRSTRSNGARSQSRSSRRY
ncbi:hypothetical protein [Ulvibacterium sp.]|uniref:hypothetical protein n=1 Tax=Ulvibacterium sp. TaxID=2665914 RepID=UPI002636C9B8|nr:hypothetical protein [Ulvibacterium sp.]